MMKKEFVFSNRGVAQPGSALALGARCRMFKSSRPDQNHNLCNANSLMAIVLNIPDQAHGRIQGQPIDGLNPKNAQKT